MKLSLGKWSSFREQGPFAAHRDTSVAGISGGRTSAFMGALLPDSTHLIFCNTGREDDRTLDFLDELDRAMDRRIVWLEFRKPKKKGDRPKNFEFAVVNYRTADRSGGPFEDMLEAIEEYRATKGDPPLAPWARQRICTSYLKHKVKEHWCEANGIAWYEDFIGLRADEPERVAPLKNASTKSHDFRMPLHAAGINKTDVLEFWQKQSFDLMIREEEGNCTGCFLKDQGDLSRLMGDPNVDSDWYIRIEKKYDRFGGRLFAGYENLMKERDQRLSIEQSLRNGTEPVSDGSLDARRFRLVVLQERRRLSNDRPGFSCSCEASMLDDDEDGEAALTG